MSSFKKVDLHLHLDGSLSYMLLDFLVKELRYDKKGKTVQELATAPAACKNLQEYLECFSFVTPLLQKEKVLMLATYDLIQRLEKQGLVYAEIRFAPQLHIAQGMTQQQAVEAVLKGVELARRDGLVIQVGILLCMMVTGAYEKNRETVELALAYRGKGVVGLDLAGAEGVVPLDSFQELFMLAHRADLPFTIHAGECGDYENIRTAVSFGARRIGHGCAAAFSKECMELLRREHIVVEMCPTSNLQTKAVTSILEHPIRRFYEDGISVTVNTDNMTVSHTTLEQEYLLLKENLNFTDTEINRMNDTALQAGFLFQ